MKRFVVIQAAIIAALLYAYSPADAQDGPQEKVTVVYPPGPPCNCDKTPGPDDPEVWFEEARNQTQFAEGSEDYEEAMNRVYLAALNLCHGEEGEFRSSFRWLGRVSPEGIIVKSHTNAKSPFGLCMDSKLLHTQVPIPPKWREPGYPVTFDWVSDKPADK